MSIDVKSCFFWVSNSWAEFFCVRDEGEGEGVDGGRGLSTSSGIGLLEDAEAACREVNEE